MPLSRSIIEEVNSKQDRKLNVLTFCAHESYQYNMAKTGHNFYIMRAKDAQPIMKPWYKEYRPMPSNVCEIWLGDGDLPLDISFDLILSHHKFGQLQIAKNIQRALQIPVINIEHTLPLEGPQKSELSKIVGDMNVFITDFSCNAWGFNPQKDVKIIKHGIDTEFFDGYVGDDVRILTVVNEYPTRPVCGFDLYKKATKMLPTMPLGNSPGFSVAAKNMQALRMAYQSCGVFLNTALLSPVPMSLLEAMSVGCPVVSTSNPMIADIISHGKNGLLADNENDMHESLKWCLEHRDEAIVMGQEARKTILEHFNLNEFIKQWNQTFEEMRGKVCQTMYVSC